MRRGLPSPRPRAAVPAELMARACAAANGAGVPVEVTRLAGGEFTMTTKLLLGVAGAALAIAGAVLAAQPDQPPKPADPPRPAVAAKADPGAQKPDPEAKGEKVAYGTPRMQRAFDADVDSASAVVWSPDGAHIAVAGMEGARGVDGRPDPAAMRSAIQAFAVDGKSGGSRLPDLGKREELVSFASVGCGLVTAVREYHLVSGHHRLRFWEPEPPEKGALTNQKFVRAVDLDASDTHGYAFAADGKTFRTVAYEYRNEGGLRNLAVRSIDAATGKTLKTLLTVERDFEQYALSQNGKRVSLFSVDGTLVLYDVDEAKQLWSKQLETPLNNRQGKKLTQMNLMEFSPDGLRLVLSSAISVDREPARVFDATTGQQLVALERADEFRFPGSASFTSNGRLLATSLNKGTSGPREYVCVWDCDTGKLLKQWNRKALVAFHPTKPILAIVEPNGEQKIRVGLWDFATEAEKK